MGGGGRAKWKDEKIGSKRGGRQKVMGAQSENERREYFQTEWSRRLCTHLNVTVSGEAT